MAGVPHPTIDTSAETVKSPPDAIRSPESPSSFQSPLRHHQRKQSTPLIVKETRNARSEYSTREDDGASELRINQYIITQEIGRGSFGAVHLARDQHGSEYAVKEFSKSRLRRRAKSNMLRRPRVERFKTGPMSPPAPSPAGGLTDPPITRYPTAPLDATDMGVDNSFDLIKEEIAVMKKLHHNNLVSLIEVLDDPDEDSLFMVLELCKKGVIMKVDVEQPSDPYDEEKCRLWFRDLILAIEYLHAQGIVHRDIKPDNCLLTDDDTLKVVDFGVSEMFEKETDMVISKSAGSPAFMAPELCEVSHGHVSGRLADIWSMGVTLFCLRFGIVPFRKNTVWDLYQAILHEEVQIPEGCNEDLADLIRKVLQKDPKQRIKMAELRNHPWVTLKGEDPLLPAEENCSHLIEPITQEEKDAAITDNMARFLAMMRAVNKFRLKFEKHRPDLVERFMGRASRLVRHPVLVQRSRSNFDPAEKDSDEMTETDLEAVEELLMEEDMQDDKETKRGMKRLIGQLRQSSLSSYLYSRASFHRGSMPAVEPMSKPTSSEPMPVPGIRKTYSEPPETAGSRGHARDLTEENFYLWIGTGPKEPGDEHTTGEENYIVSESPTQADTKMYERAYQDEVTSILRRKGRETTVYLTRRVDRKKNEIFQAALERSERGTEAAKAKLTSWNDRVAEMGKNQPNTYRGQAKAGFASVIGKALTHSKAYMEAHPISESFGSSSSSKKATEDQDPDPTQEAPSDETKKG